MKFELSDAFSRFFSKHGIIEFEETFSENDLRRLSDKLREQQIVSLHGKPIEIGSNDDLWKAGRNLFDSDPEIKKVLLKSPVGVIASFLFKKKPIRLGFLQTILGNPSDSSVSFDPTLDQIGSLTPILGGALLCLERKKTPSEHPLPNLAEIDSGRIIFFRADTVIPLSSFVKEAGLHCLLFCFVPQKVRYKFQKSDVTGHELKKSGYGFGDEISEKEVPYLYH